MRAAWDPVAYRSKRYWENLLSLGIICVLASISFAYINRLAAGVEQASVQRTLSILRQSVQVVMVEKIISGDWREFERYDDGNPFAMFAQMPGRYAGEYTARDGLQVPAGRWYFELDSRQAVYRFMNQLPWDETGKKEIRLSLQFEPAGGNALPLKLLEVSESDMQQIEDETGEH